MSGGTQLLRELAERTENAPQPEGTGRYHYVHTRGVHLHLSHYLRRSGGHTTTGAVEPYERRDWLAADGSGRIEVVKDGELVQPTGDFGPGELPGHLLITAVDDTAAVLLELGKRQTTTTAVVHAFRQVWNLQVVTPALQRVLLLHLARCPDLSVDGPNTVAHLDTARHRRRLLEFSGETGMLLRTEETAFEGAPIPIPTPAVVNRTEWLYSGYRETTTPPSAR
jgi:hypothetical protein